MQPLTRNQLSAYLARVQLPDTVEEVRPDLHMLCKMQLAHVQQIPYENLSFHLDKVSRRQTGGVPIWNGGHVLLCNSMPIKLIAITHAGTEAVPYSVTAHRRFVQKIGAKPKGRLLL